MNLLTVISLGLLACAPARPHPTPTPAPAPTLVGLTYDGGKSFAGASLTAGQVHTVTARTTATSSVIFSRDGTAVKIDVAAPFDFIWTPTVIGLHSFSAKPIGPNGRAGIPYTVSFRVVASTPTPTPTPTPRPTPTATPSPSPTPTPTPTPVQEVSVTVSQPEPNGADIYTLYYGTASDVYDPPISGGVTGIWNLTLKPNTTYYFASTARNTTGESNKSQETVYTTTMAAVQKLELR